MHKEDFAEAQTVAASQIPIIDISSVVSGQGVERVAKDIFAAATGPGFFYVKGHGIDQALLDQAFAVSRAFFELPEDQKASVAVNQHQRGWMATGQSRLQGSKTHDLKEVFFWGREVAHDDVDYLAGKALVAPNQWPNDIFPELERDLKPYYDAVCRVAMQVLSAIAVSLDQSADFFEDKYQKPLARGQLVFYPPSTQADEAEERFGVAPHTDFGVLTFLLQDNSGGLQVLTKAGDWIEAPPIPGTLVCNIGDLLQRWSNDRFVSNVHRVINRTQNARYSIPVFFDPASETLIDPQELGAKAEDNTYDVMSAGNYIASRNKKSFGHFNKK